MGIIVPDMGNSQATVPRVSEAAARYASASLSDALFTATQQRVLSSLFGEPGRSATVSELIHTTGAGSGAVQRELARLAGSGLLIVERIGNQKRYRANPDCPIHDELVGIVRKTFGLSNPLRAALAPLADRIHAAFVFGSHARRSDTASSDIDLFLVSDQLGYGEVMAVLHPLMATLRREINPTLYTREELQQRLAKDSAFLSRIREQPKLWLMGNNLWSPS